MRVGAGSSWCSKICDTISVLKLPDLYLTTDEIMIDPNPVHEDSLVFIGVNIRNIGTDTAFSPNFALYLGDPDAGGRFMASRTVPVNIPPGGSSGAFYGFWFWFQGVGVGDIYAVADYTNSVVELNEANNKASKTIQVVAFALSAAGAGDDSTQPRVEIRSLGPAGLAEHVAGFTIGNDIADDDDHNTH